VLIPPLKTLVHCLSLQNGYTPLLEAISHKRTIVAKWLVLKGADIHSKQGHSRPRLKCRYQFGSPLLLAREQRMNSVITLLLEKGAVDEDAVTVTK
jgi:hypothetical protein